MKIFNLLITSIIFFIAICTYAQDSVRVVPLNLTQGSNGTSSSHKVSYPIIETDNSDIAKQIQSLHFDAAKKTLQGQLTQAKRKKQATDLIESQIQQCENGLSALRATNKIVFIDSIIVDKEQFLSAYKYDKELGSITLSADKQSTSFTTELGNFTYRTENKDGKLTIRSYFIEDGILTNPSPLNGIDFDGDMNYPFLLSDGTTLYFASRTEEGLGNYDIYVTRLDTEDNTYLQPTNIGFPFNSYANDYMMIIDENLGIGWFASDRYQPEDKVCIYTFLQPKSRHTFDYETDDHEIIMRAAKIASIKDTWKDNEDAIRTARQQLTLKQNALVESETDYDFSFIINDQLTYHSLNDFKNPSAKNKFADYQKQMQEYETLSSTLSQLRQNPRGTTISSQILQLESQLANLYQIIHQAEKQIRSLELQ